jgi:uncharacterized protein GlcG (DUF336 family)
MTMHQRLITIALGLACSCFAFADEDDVNGSCGISSNVVKNVQNQLAVVVVLNNGAIFGQIRPGPNRMWSAVVDRKGNLCSVIKTGDSWPGSRAIAIAKAETANDFSNDSLALSTANLYSATQPGGALYGLNNSNPFNPDFLRQGTGIGKVPGGIITFGGGVALYSGGEVIGGLGLSGDSACADHVIAFRMRRLAGLDKIPAGVGFGGTDNIDYLGANEAPNGFKHPHCFPNIDIPPGNI